MAMEHQPSGQAPAGSGDANAARALRVQILSTEHWSLLATRSLSWNESFARAGMFLTLLSGAIVALALVAQATAFGQAFALFAMLILPVVLFVGLATFVRLLEINNEDYVWVKGMNRLRGAYLEIDPGLAGYFVTGTAEDAVSIFRTFGSDVVGPRALNVGRFHGLVTTPTTIAFVDAMLAAVLAAVVGVQLSMDEVPAAGIGVVAFFVVGIVLFLFGYRSQEMARLAVGLPPNPRAIAAHTTGGIPMTDQPAPPAPPASPDAPPPAPPPAPESTWAAPPPPPPSNRPGPMAGWHYAGFWVRFLAFLIDGILLAVVTAPFAPFWGQDFSATSANFQVHAQVNPVGTLIGLVYLAGMWSWRGQTIGMMPFNMKVVGVADGKNIDIFRGLLRYVGFIIAAIPLLIGLIWAAFDARKQGWHDKIAGTVVIRPN